MDTAFATFPVALFSSFALIFLAEMGDKSQLVCMTLAARYRPWPVLFGAIMAFMLLNIVAVVFGASIASWMPRQVILVIVGTLFLVFGFHALFHPVFKENGMAEHSGSHSLFFSTLLLITLAEFGDKTQLAVAGLGSTSDPLAVWLGATLALSATTLLGVMAGRVMMQRLSIDTMRKLGGALFVLIGLLVLLRLWS